MNRPPGFQRLISLIDSFRPLAFKDAKFYDDYLKEVGNERIAKIDEWCESPGFYDWVNQYANYHADSVQALADAGAMGELEFFESCAIDTIEGIYFQANSLAQENYTEEEFAAHKIAREKMVEEMKADGTLLE
jgi:hypothetical protein